MERQHKEFRLPIGRAHHSRRCSAVEIDSPTRGGQRISLRMAARCAGRGRLSPKHRISQSRSRKARPSRERTRWPLRVVRLLRRRASTEPGRAAGREGRSGFSRARRDHEECARTGAISLDCGSRRPGANDPAKAFQLDSLQPNKGAPPPPGKPVFLRQRMWSSRRARNRRHSAMTACSRSGARGRRITVVVAVRQGRQRRLFTIISG